MPAAADIGSWIAQEYRVAAREMLRSISAENLVYPRPAFGQSIRPARGSVLASPVTDLQENEPDYFFHWLRDSAIVMGAVEELIADGTLGDEGHAAFADFVGFSTDIDALDGRRLAADPDYGVGVAPEVRQYLRPRAEIAGVYGDRVRMEARFNPDGSLDVIRWARPQLDGPATRALALMRYARRYGQSNELTALIDADIDFTLRYAGAESYDIWEERYCADYYSRSVQQQALAEAAASARAQGKTEQAETLSAASHRLGHLLDEHWSDERSAYLRAAGTDGPRDRDVDFAIVFAALHSDRREGPHSILDPRVQASLAALVDIFANDYAINRARPGAAPAMGRFRGDIYQSGGAYYFSSLGAAEFHYRLAHAARERQLVSSPVNEAFLLQAGIAHRPLSPKAGSDALIKRGDDFMQTIRHFVPRPGALSEQFDQTDGRQSSARHLAWSYAAFITAAAARRRACSDQAIDT